MIISNKKRAIKGILCFILLISLIFTMNLNKAYAANVDYTNCECVLDHVSLTINGSSYNTKENTYTLDDSVKTLAVSDISISVISEGAMSGAAFQAGEHFVESFYLPLEHPVKVYCAYSEADLNTSRRIDLGESTNNDKNPSLINSIDITGKNDVYFKFVLKDKGESDASLAKYIHFKRNVKAVDTTISISKISASPSELPSSGGTCKVHVKGKNLPKNIQVTAYHEDSDEEIKVSAGKKSGTKADFNIKIPANNTGRDLEYTIEPVVNGEPFEIDTKITVLGNSVNAKTADESDNFYPTVSILLAMLAICLAVLSKELIRLREYNDFT